MKKINKGKFIVIEGLDGSGQSTQLELLKEYLKSKGRKVHMTVEPTNNIIGGLIRGFLTKQWQLSNTGKQLLFCADRAHHLETEIIPAIESGHIVISSRYYFSTIAYGSLNNDIKWLETLNEKFLQPDAIFFLNVSPKKCIERIKKSRFRKEFFEEEKKLKKVMETYLKICRDKKYKNVFIIDGEYEIEKVHQSIVKILEKIN
jgi:dTMP kinase